jgi:hypothetical protein
MQLREYFQEIRRIEAELVEEYPTVETLKTSDGGKAGVRLQLDRETAARMIVERRAVLVSKPEPGKK